MYSFSLEGSVDKNLKISIQVDKTGTQPQARRLASVDPGSCHLTISANFIPKFFNLFSCQIMWQMLRGVVTPLVYFFFFFARCGYHSTVTIFMGVTVNDLVIGVIYSLGYVARRLKYSLTSLI